MLSKPSTCRSPSCFNSQVGVALKQVQIERQIQAQQTDRRTTLCEDRKLIRGRKSVRVSRALFAVHRKYVIGPSEDRSQLLIGFRKAATLMSDLSIFRCFPLDCFPMPSGLNLAFVARMLLLSVYSPMRNIRRIRSCQTKTISRSSTAFERTSKRRRGYPSETRVKRGFRVVHSEKELIEKLGRNDLCPCGSGRRFQELLSP